MAYGIEVIFGYCYKDFFKIAKLIGEKSLKLDDAFDKIRTCVDKEKLITVHMKTLEEVGFQEVRRDGDYLIAQTPKGERKFSPFVFELHFDPWECEEEVEDAFIGVSLSSRYKPTLLDWEDEHGAMYTYVFGEETNRMIEIAKKHIVEAIPELIDANVAVKFKHY